MIMPAPLLLDLSHTCHTRARTGIQRVTRSLHAALGGRALAITHDPHLHAWRELEPWERATLAAAAAAARRGAHWPVGAKLRGLVRRRLGPRAAPLPANRGLVVPEVFSPPVARALPELFAQVAGPRIALFHDAIALQFPELTPRKTVARFPPYLVELLAFDGIAAVSEDSRAALVDYWRWLGAPSPPRAARSLRAALGPRVRLHAAPHRARPSGNRRGGARADPLPPGRRPAFALRRPRHRRRRRGCLCRVHLHRVSFADRRLRPASAREPGPRQTLHLLGPGRAG
jgi:hypothetical protein